MKSELEELVGKLKVEIVSLKERLDGERLNGEAIAEARRHLAVVFALLTLNFVLDMLR